VPTPTPELLTALLARVIQEAARQAEQPTEVTRRAVEGAVDRVTRVTEPIIDELRSAVDPPTWPTLLMYVLMKVSRLDEDHLTVGSLDPGRSWAPAVTLTYTEGDPDDPNDAALTVALALTDTDPPTGKKLGVIVRLTGDVAADFPAAGGGRLSVRIDGTGNGEWRIPFEGEMAVEGDAELTVWVQGDPQIERSERFDDIGNFDVEVNAAQLVVTLRSVEPRWRLDVGLDPENEPGVQAELDLRPGLGNFLGGFLSPSVKYSPRLSVAAGAAPTFSLGQES
jgi:hypothetical protein